ncbi:kappaPI-actitoxin-Avd3c isoform X1 [Drosophila biarmipes]|uniref:kappaPI-actitoxin-Avd3c isoform X1 n=1 Tax=Drosophila biarmipes TaxID=125945 RepID=UPI0007E6D88B|nr:kappaPI-actitoxin-Avd3c isoform X1 [Drosophila biarmipes]
MLLKISCLLVILVICLQQSQSMNKRCLKPLKEGTGKAYLRSWFYNSTAQRCQRFIFLGGARNGNHFKTKARCRKICLAQVALPIKLSSTDDGV